MFSWCATMPDTKSPADAAPVNALEEQYPAGKELIDFLVNSPFGILIVDVQGVIRFANRAAAAIFDCTVDQLIEDFCGLGPLPDTANELAVRMPGGRNLLLQVERMPTEWTGLPATLLHLQDVTERKRVEEELRESEKKFSKAFQAVPELLSISRLADGKYVEVNEALEKALGLSRDEIIGRTSLELGIWEDPADRDRLVGLLQEQGSVRGLEVRLRGRTGEVVIGSVSAELIDVKGEECLLALTRDISGIRQAEQSLQESEERYRSLVELAPDAVILHLDGRFIYANPAALQMFGAESFAQLKDHHLLELIHPDDREVVRERMALIREGTKVPLRALKMLRLDGREVPVEAAGSVIEYRGKPAVQAIIRDISERKRAEEALRESENRFRTLAAASYEGIAITEGGRILDVNDQLTEILGYGRDELIGRNVADLLPPGERDRVMANILTGQEGRIAHEMLCRDGSRRIVEARARTIDQQGRQLRITAIRDNTERKRAEEQIETLNTDLMARAAELEAVNGELEAFSYTVSHDLRKPLTIINGYSQLILELCGNTLGEECTRYIREICEGTLRMNSLIETLLDFSLLTQVEIKRETVDLSGLAQFIASGLRKMEPERRATFTIAEGVTCFGDADLLGVVLENLLGNAWKYTAGNSESVIEFGAFQRGAQDAESGNRPGMRKSDAGKDAPVYFVRDNGAGFDMAQAEDLFAPFQRLHGSTRFQGHGIGLATVHRIIKRHGGSVWAEGEHGKGATFFFTLPAEQARN
jgi:PAS domain S-box-containing protein